MLKPWKSCVNKVKANKPVAKRKGLVFLEFFLLKLGIFTSVLVLIK